MPFVESSKSLRSQAHMSDVKTPVLIGILVLLGMCLMFFGGNIVTAASGTSFEIESSAAAQRSTAGAPSSEEGVGEGAGASASSEAVPEQVAEVFVFVSGAVQYPGVYKLPADARVGDAVNSAGGFAEGAATDYNNLARLLVDGEQIHVPLLSEVEAALGAGQVAATPQGAAPGGAAGSAPGGAAGTTAGSAPGQVNINTATQAELESLPGIGPATAQKIIASRESEGPFSTPDELMRVSGIGEKKYEAVEGLICV